MKLEDMILVTENCKGTESIFLQSLSDYMELVLKAYGNSATGIADAVRQLYETKKGKGGCSELYFRRNISSQAVFCGSVAQLQGFLMGIGVKEHGKKPIFDRARCSTECFDVLKTYGVCEDGNSLFNLHYEAKKYDFRQGEVLHNLNGCDYRVLSVLSEKNLLLMSQSDGQYIVADSTVMYERYPKEEEPSEDNIVRGIEWGHGIYLGNDFMKIDFDGIIREYGRGQMNSIEDYRDEVRWQFVKLKSLSQNTKIGQTVRWAAEKEMSEIFGTMDRENFEKNLEKGNYDNGFHEQTISKEKSR